LLGLLLMVHTHPDKPLVLRRGRTCLAQATIISMSCFDEHD